MAIKQRGSRGVKWAIAVIVFGLGVAGGAKADVRENLMRAECHKMISNIENQCADMLGVSRARYKKYGDFAQFVPANPPARLDLASPVVASVLALAALAISAVTLVGVIVVIMLLRRDRRAQ